jgi:hypothetical protein
MTIIVKDRFGPAPGPPGLGGLGGGGPCAVIVIGSTHYELRRAAAPGCFTLARVGAAYQVWVGGGGNWSCTCPSATFRRDEMCKHARALATLRGLFREVTCSTGEGG